MTQHLYLVPGFFGFISFGEFKYFSHLREHLEPWFAERDLDVAIHYAPTLPTASLRQRAGRLLEIVAETAPDDDSPIHFVGHSTGGLDARLLASPGASLSGEIDPEPFARRVRTVVGVSAPHYGAPVAGVFGGVLGRDLLKVLSATTVHAIRLGSVPLPALLVLASTLGGIGLRRPRATGGVLDQVYRLVLQDFSDERQEQMQSYFAAAVSDQALLPQLAPEAMDLFNAATVDREGVRYGSVVTQAPRPSLWRNARVGVDPVRQANYALFRTLYQLSTTLPLNAAPELDPGQRTALRVGYGRVPALRANDAMVPTLSQVYGEVVHVAWADHLDTIGHFDDREHAPVHVDWVRSMSGFRRPQFEALWDDVARFIIDS